MVLELIVPLITAKYFSGVYTLSTGLKQGKLHEVYARCFYSSAEKPRHFNKHCQAARVALPQAEKATMTELGGC